MKAKIFFIAALGILATGCSSEDRKLRQQFLSSCAADKSLRAVCNCIYDGIRKEYSLDELKRIDRGEGNHHQFQADVLLIGATCRINAS